MRDMSPTNLGCPQYRAKNQDGKALVGFRSVLDDVRVHQQDQDGNPGDKEDPLPFQYKGTERRRDIDDTGLFFANEYAPAHQVRGICRPTTLLRQHLAPDGIAFPSYMLSLMDLQLLYSSTRIIAGDTFGVQRDEAIYRSGKFVLGALKEGKPGLDVVVQVTVLEL